MKNLLLFGSILIFQAFTTHSQNLLKDPGFEFALVSSPFLGTNQNMYNLDGIEIWRGYPFVSFEFVSNPVKEGKGALKAYYRDYGTGTPGFRYGEHLNLPAGTYTISFWYRTDTDRGSDSNGYIEFHWGNGAGASGLPYQFIGIDSIDIPSGAADTYQFYSTTITLEKNYTEFRLTWKLPFLKPGAFIFFDGMFFGQKEPSGKAFYPFPDDGAKIPVNSLSLSWYSGNNAVYHNFYLGIHPDSLELIQENIPENRFYLEDLLSGTEYFWRIDEIDHADSVITGDVWDFSTSEDSGEGAVRKLEVFNLFDKPIHSACIPLDADELYTAGYFHPGTPLKFSIEGKKVPAVQACDGKHIFIYLGMEPGKKVVVDVEEESGFDSPDALVTAFKEDGIIKLNNSFNEGRISQGGVTFLFAAEGTEEKELIRNLGYYGYAGDIEYGQMTEAVAIEKGLGKIDLRNAQIVSDSFGVREDHTAYAILEKKISSKYTGSLRFIETIELLPFEPVLIYQLEMINEDTEEVVLQNVHESGIIGNYGEVMSGKDRLFLRRASSAEKCPPLLILEKGGVTTDILKPSQGWEKAMTYLEEPSGYGLGVTNIYKQVYSHQWHRWKTGMSDFRMPATTSTSALPIHIPAGQKINLGAAVAGFIPGSNGFSLISTLYDRFIKGAEGDVFTGLSCLMNGRVISGSLITQFIDDFNDTQHWHEGKNKLELAVDLDFEINPWLVFGSNEKVNIHLSSSAGTIQIADGLEIAGLDLAALTEWSGVKSCLIRVSSESVLPGMTFFSISEKPLSAVALDYPVNLDTISSYASVFSFTLQENVVEYLVEIARDPDFSDMVYSGKNRYPSQGRLFNGRHYMDNPLAAGDYYWRVAALSIMGVHGDWSEVRRTVVDTAVIMIDPVIDISPQNPHFLLEAWRVGDPSFRPEINLGNFKDIVPDDLKDHVTIYFDTRITQATMQESYDYKMRNFVNGNNPLSDIEHAFKTNPYLTGLWMGEEFGDFERFKRMVKLCARYGRIFTFGNGFMGPSWFQVYSDPEMQSFMKKYRRYILLGHKTNISNHAHISGTANMGAMLSGLMDNSAFLMEAFYWDHAGYLIEEDINYGERGGQLNYMPPIFWCVQSIVGITQGNTMLHFGGQGGTTLGSFNNNIHSVAFWKEGEGDNFPDESRYTAFWSRDGQTTPIYHKVLIPFLRALLKYDLFPTRQEILNNIKMTIIQDNSPQNYVLGYNNWGPFTPLVNTAYQPEPVAIHSELVPNSGRYFWLPVIPYGMDGLEGKENISLTQLWNDDATKDIVDGLYPENYTGNASVIKINDKFFILSGKEHSIDIQTFNMPFEFDGGIKSVSGEIKSHTYYMGKVFRNGDSLFLQTNSHYTTEPSQLEFVCISAPKVVVSPAEALISSVWNEESKTQTITFSRLHDAVELILVTSPTVKVPHQRQSENLRIYPNPSRDSFLISGFNGDAEVHLVDTQGRSLVQKRVSENEEVNVEAIFPGIYSVIITTDDTFVIRRLVIN